MGRHEWQECDCGTTYCEDCEDALGSCSGCGQSGCPECMDPQGGADRRLMCALCKEKALPAKPAKPARKRAKPVATSPAPAGGGLGLEAVRAELVGMRDRLSDLIERL